MAQFTFIYTCHLLTLGIDLAKEGFYSKMFCKDRKLIRYKPNIQSKEDIDICRDCFEEWIFAGYGGIIPEKCPYGGTYRRLCDEIFCLYCYLKSFASHSRGIYWLEKN